jgi:tRNA (uracil-5-)-methyltransferase TRM9
MSLSLSMSATQQDKDSLMQHHEHPDPATSRSEQQGQPQQHAQDISTTRSQQLAGQDTDSMAASSSSPTTTATTTTPATLAPPKMPPPEDTRGATYEQTHVHAVYESIAPHFSATRHKPWPIISSFLLSLPPGSIGLDVGCGNGKYLSVNPSLYIMGCDRSAKLVSIAREEKQGEVVVTDGLSLPYRCRAVDFAICVAVIHHLSTRERRREAVEALLECVRAGRVGSEGGGDAGNAGDAGGKILVYVWALEQSSSRRGWDEGADQDQLVPWVMKTKTPDPKATPVPDKTYQRYYHLYRKGELEEDVEAAGGVVMESGYDRDNWYVIARRKK